VDAAVVALRAAVSDRATVSAPRVANVMSKP